MVHGRKRGQARLENKKLIIINILTVVAFIIVVVLGLSKSKSTKENFSNIETSEEQEIVMNDRNALNQTTLTFKNEFNYHTDEQGLEITEVDDDEEEVEEEDQTDSDAYRKNVYHHVTIPKNDSIKIERSKSGSKENDKEKDKKKETEEDIPKTDEKDKESTEETDPKEEPDPDPEPEPKPENTIDNGNDVEENNNNSDNNNDNNSEDNENNNEVNTENNESNTDNNTTNNNKEQNEKTDSNDHKQIGKDESEKWFCKYIIKLLLYKILLSFVKLWNLIRIILFT